MILLQLLLLIVSCILLVSTTSEPEPLPTAATNLTATSCWNLTANNVVCGREVSSLPNGRQLLQMPKSIAPVSKLCRGIVVSEADISHDIFGKHKSWERPRIDGRVPVDVEIQFFLSAINELIEKDRILALTGYLSFTWFDEFNLWNNTFPHACLSSVVMPHKDVWIPELALINSERHYEILLMQDGEMVKISSNGLVHYQPGGTFHSFCNFDMTYFPYDEQKCDLTLESWRYTTEHQRFFVAGNVQFNHWIENEQWLLVNTSYQQANVIYVNEDNHFARVVFSLHIRRKVGYYLINVIIPSVIISIAEIATFTLPVEEVLKIHVSFTCLLAYGIFQLMIIEAIPRTSDRIPLLSYYVVLSMAWICLAILGEGLVFVCVRKSNDKRHRQIAPRILVDLASILAYILRIKRPETVVKWPDVKTYLFGKTNNDEELMLNFPIRWEPTLFISMFDASKTPIVTPFDNLQRKLQQAIEDRNTHEKSDSQRRHEWEFVSQVFDRFFLIFYVFLIVLTPIIMFRAVPKYIDG